MDNVTDTDAAERRFLTVEQAAAELNVSENQVRTLLHSGDLRGIQIGGRGLWRIGREDIEKYIAEAYARTAARIASGELEDPAAATGGVPD